VFLGLAGAGKPNRLPVEEEGARIGLVNTGDDLDQGGLAGAVLAQQSMDFAGEDLEMDIL
jgi:hypothetical protein